MGNQFKKICVFCIKSTLLLFNIVLGLIAVVLLVSGLLVEIQMYSDERYKVPDFPDTFFYSVIGIGILVLILCSLGCSCITKGESILLYLYGGILTVIFIAILGFEISLITYKSKFKDMFSNGLNVSFTKAYSGIGENAFDFNFLQSTLHCCGIKNYSDWLRLVPARKVPSSCCINEYECSTGNIHEIYTSGCNETILDFFKTSPSYVALVLIFSSFIPIIAAILSCCLANQMKKEKYDVIA